MEALGAVFEIARPVPQFAPGRPAQERRDDGPRHDRGEKLEKRPLVHGWPRLRSYGRVPPAQMSSGARFRCALVNRAMACESTQLPSRTKFAATAAKRVGRAGCEVRTAR